MDRHKSIGRFWGTEVLQLDTAASVQARASSTLERDRDQPATEALDSFMQGVAAESAEEGVRRLEHQARLTQEQIKQVTQLLDIADPSRDHRKRLQTGK